MIQIGAGRTLRRLDQMLTDAIDGVFDESRYDETELSRLEARWKQYLTTSRMSMEQTKKERASMKALVSDISHQTRTPLSNILLYSELLMEQSESENEKRLAGQILEQTEKLEFLIQALVKMSRLESDVLEIVPTIQNVRVLIREVIGEHRPKAEHKGIQIRYEEGQLYQSDECGSEGEMVEEWEAAYDRKWTCEALGNILDNAVKYSPQGSTIQVEVRIYEFYVCINIRDQGIGIPEEEKAAIFGRFYRSSWVQQQDGIGIGLYLAREILQKENGYIKVSSREGEGSCFGVYLPRWMK